MKRFKDFIIEHFNNKEEIINESFIDTVFGVFKKNNEIMNRINKSKNNLKNIAKNTVGTYKSVGKDGIKAFIGDIAYLISNDEKCKTIWNNRLYKIFSQMNDKSKNEIIQNMYNDSGSGYKEIFEFIKYINEKMTILYKWPNIDQTVFNNNNKEPEDELNYDLYINTFQIIAIEITKQK